MPITGYHVFTSPVADGTNTQLVRPSNWNSNHLFTANLSGSEISGAFSNANNLTFGLETNGFLTASASYPAQSVQPVAISGSNGSFAFSTVTMGNLNGLSFYTSNGSVVASHNGLTTAAQSDHSHGNPTLALTNLSGTTASNSGGFTLSLSAALGGGAGDGYNILAAGTQTAGTAATVNFANSNGITFGMSNSSQITASHNGLTQQSTQPVAYSAANGSANFSTLPFANSNGVSFSTGTQGVYATVATNYQSQGAYLTTARASNDAIGLNTALTANGLSVTANSSGLSINVPAWLTTAAQSNHSHGNPTLALTNINGTTASASNGLTLSLSAIVPAQTVQPVAASGSNGSFEFSTLSFGASNGLTFYTTNGSIVASYTDAGAGGGDGYNIVQIGTTGTSGTAWSSVSATVRLNGDGVIRLTQNNSNDIGVNHAAVNQFIPYYPASTGAMGIAAGIGVSSGSVNFFPVSVGEPVIANRIRIHHTVSHISSSVSGRQTLGMRWGLFSNNAGTALSLITSNSMSFAITNSSASATLSYATASSDSGYGYGTTSASATALVQSLWGTMSNRAIDFMLGGTSLLAPGMYWLGVLHTASTSSAAVGMSVQQAGNAMAGGQNILPIGVSSAAANIGYDFGWGALTITTTGMVQSAAITNIANTATQLPMVTFMSM